MSFPVLARLHRQLHDNHWLVRFTALTRILIAVGFLPSGLTKIRGARFTSLGLDTSVGFFFEAFYRNPLWYHVVGWAQVVAAILLLMPRTAHLGAMLFFPIIFNIWLVTVGIQFQGTWVITSLMLLANLWLLAWEYDRIAPLLELRPSRRAQSTESYRWWALVGALGAVAAYGAIFALDMGLVRASLGAAGFAIAAIAGAVGGSIVAWHARGMV
jgi:uncharacterized membrane protein YphA (DoxX/SURF4 family)